MKYIENTLKYLHELPTVTVSHYRISRIIAFSSIIIDKCIVVIVYLWQIIKTVIKNHKYGKHLEVKQIFYIETCTTDA